MAGEESTVALACGVAKSVASNECSICMEAYDANERYPYMCKQEFHPICGGCVTSIAQFGESEKVLCPECRADGGFAPNHGKARELGLRVNKSLGDLGVASAKRPRTGPARAAEPPAVPTWLREDVNDFVNGNISLRNAVVKFYEQAFSACATPQDRSRLACRALDIKPGRQTTVTWLQENLTSLRHLAEFSCDLQPSSCYRSMHACYVLLRFGNPFPPSQSEVPPSTQPESLASLNIVLYMSQKDNEEFFAGGPSLSSDNRIVAFFNQRFYAPGQTGNERHRIAWRLVSPIPGLQSADSLTKLRASYAAFAARLNYLCEHQVRNSYYLAIHAIDIILNGGAFLPMRRDSWLAGSGYQPHWREDGIYYYKVDANGKLTV